MANFFADLYAAFNVLLATPLPGWFPVLGLGVAGFALTLTLKNYLRKSGLDLRGTYTLVKSDECSERFVSSFVIENLKDRSIVIFGIYLKIGHGIYIELKRFDDGPMILKGFEAYSLECGPIQFYEFNGFKVNLNDILIESRKPRLTLSTGDGRYVIPKAIRVWDPNRYYFQNLATVVARPWVLKHNGVHIGSNADYIVEFILENQAKEQVLLSREFSSGRIFADFEITNEALESKAYLELFLLDRIRDGKFKTSSFTIIEIYNWKREMAERYPKVIKLVPKSWLHYHVISRTYTWLDSLNMFKMKL